MTKTNQIGLILHCRTQAERDLYWLYRDSDGELGMHAFDFGAQTAHVEPSTDMPESRMRAADRQATIRAVLREMSPYQATIIAHTFALPEPSTAMLARWELASGAMRAVLAASGVGEHSADADQLGDAVRKAVNDALAAYDEQRRVIVERNAYEHDLKRERAERRRESLLAELRAEAKRTVKSGKRVALDGATKAMRELLGLMTDATLDLLGVP